MFETREPANTHELEYSGSLAKIYEYPALHESRGTIVMIHGFRGNHHGLERLVTALAQYRILVPDLPNFGNSSPVSGPHTLDMYVDFVMALHKRLHLEADTVLLGHSFGSIVATHVCAEHPDAFASLIVVNPISRSPLAGMRGLAGRATAGLYAVAKAAPAPLGNALMRSKLLVEGMSWMMTKSRYRSMRQYVRDQHNRHFSDFHEIPALTDAFQASISHTVRDVAGSITVPTLIIDGELDELSTVSSRKELAAAIQHSTQVSISGVGHLIHYETPCVAASLIEDFLDSTS